MESNLYQPSFSTDEVGMYIDPITKKPRATPYVTPEAAVAQVGGRTGGNPSGQPSEMDRMTMEYMLTMGQQQPALDAAAKKAELGKQLRGEAGDTSGVMDAGRLKPFSLGKALGGIAEKVAGGYAQGKAGRAAEAAGLSRMDAFRKMAGKHGFGGGDGLKISPNESLNEFNW
jgi:hypothetical protein